VKKLPNKAEQVVECWKVSRRCDGGDGRRGRIEINKVSPSCSISAFRAELYSSSSPPTDFAPIQDFESIKELILATGLAVTRQSTFFLTLRLPSAEADSPLTALQNGLSRRIVRPRTL
jgi:hypothetical protein